MTSAKRFDCLVEFRCTRSYSSHVACICMCIYIYIYIYIYITLTEKHLHCRVCKCLLTEGIPQWEETLSTFPGDTKTIFDGKLLHYQEKFVEPFCYFKYRLKGTPLLHGDWDSQLTLYPFSFTGLGAEKVSLNLVYEREFWPALSAIRISWPPPNMGTWPMST